jgi:hypothetical protein
MKHSAFISTLILGIVSLGAHAQTTYNFQSLPQFTAVTNQLAGLTVSLNGGPNDSGPAITGSFDSFDLGNSTTDGFPTAQQLIFTFSSPTSNDSFGFTNFGDNNEFGAPSFFYAYDGTTLVSSGNIGSDNDDTMAVIVPGSDITSLVIDNGSGGNYSWQVGVSFLTVDGGSVSATPEPASFVTLGSGLLGVAGSLYRRRRSMR